MQPMAPPRLVGDHSAGVFSCSSMSMNHLLLKMRVPTEASDIKLASKITASKLPQEWSYASSGTTAGDKYSVILYHNLLLRWSPGL